MVLKIEDFSFKYNGSSTYSLKNCNVEIESGGIYTICGKSGCGKTTLLRNIKREVCPSGDKQGKIIYNGYDIVDIDSDISVRDIGFISQNPSSQIVCDTVISELAFGLENMGESHSEIHSKLAEISSYFGLSKILDDKIETLSGGQKQLLNLASVMVMQPKLLLLDEPMSQLDPIASKSFLSALKQVNEELGITILISEHSLEEVLPICDGVIFMDMGEIIFTGTPNNFFEYLLDKKEQYFLKCIPTATRLFLECSNMENTKKVPILVKEGRDWLNKYIDKNYIEKTKTISEEEILEDTQNPEIIFKEVWFGYEKKKPILHDLSFTINRGKIYSILGANGSGKTTLLNLISGFIKPNYGKIKYSSKNIGLLFQDIKGTFCFESVEKELGYAGQSDINLIESCAEQFNLKGILKSHPYDISGGEQQRLALAKVMMNKPDILLLDEPTKGMDLESKTFLGNKIRNISNQGTTVVIVTHDLEFSALYTDFCSMLFNGGISSAENVKDFFSHNNYYTTNSVRITKGIVPVKTTCEELIEWIKKQKI